MSFTGSLTAIAAHCTTAGAAVTPAIETVRKGELQTAERQITIQYVGDTENPFGHHTLGKTQMGEKVAIKVWLPIWALDVATVEALEAQLQDVKARIKSLLWGDKKLGGECMDIEIGDASTEFETLIDDPSKHYRTLTIPITIGLADVDTISE